MPTQPEPHPPVEGQEPLPLDVAPTCPKDGLPVAPGRRLCKAHQDMADKSTVRGLMAIDAARARGAGS